MSLVTETQIQDMSEQSWNFELKTSNLLHSNTGHNLHHEQSKFLQCSTLSTLTVDAKNLSVRDKSALSTKPKIKIQSRTNIFIFCLFSTFYVTLALMIIYFVWVYTSPAANPRVLRVSHNMRLVLNFLVYS